MAISVPVAPKTTRKPSVVLELLRYALDNWTLLLLALPGVALIFALRYIPMFGMVVAFQDFNAKSGFLSPWVGLRNFRLLWESPVLVRLVRNTIGLNFLFISSSTFFSVLIALLLNEVRFAPFRRISQSLMFLPFFMGWAIVSMVLHGMIDYNVGTINVLLDRVGLERIAITGDASLWPALLTALNIWKGTGSGCIIYLAVLTGIDPELFEAAAIDGANRFQRIRYISLPMLVSTVILLTLLAIGRIFHGNFGMIYALVGMRANLYPTTDVIDTYIIRSLQTSQNFGMSTAVGLSQSVLGFICILGSNLLARRYSRKQGENYALF